MSEAFRAAAHLGRLKDFQRRTVRHVVQRMYDDPTPTRRFLVADETGLGKSVVARGVIAEAVERLLRDDRVDRIDVVYVCSNSDIARQNLSRLNVLDEQAVHFQTRLTMLAATGHQLHSGNDQYGKPVNLIAFTPGTSFEKGWRTGKAEERALLAVILAELLPLSTRQRTALHRILQGGVTTLGRFQEVVSRQDAATLDATIVAAFARSFLGSSIADDVLGLIGEVEGKHSLHEVHHERARHLTGELRTLLARASVHALEPDLIILDEFQRFRHLLDPEKGGEAAELAHSLFEWPEARTLLLSATPYKPFTLAEEDEAGEDHYSDLMTTLRFLSSADDDWLAEVREAFASFRSALLAGRASEDLMARVRHLLLRHMCRTERPHVADAHTEVSRTADAVTSQDFADFVGLRQLAALVDSSVPVEYWKSAPYFINFLEGYQVGERVKERLKKRRGVEALAPALAHLSRLRSDDLEAFRPVDLGNARLRALAERTVQQGWWQLLWIPPSMPYMEPAGPYAEPFAASVTKQLVFSSWSATPTAVAGLLSYEAERRLAEHSVLAANTPAARQRLSARLTYPVEADKAAAMSTLALFWPHPALAELTDPLLLARQRPESTPSPPEAVDWAAGQLGNAAAGAATNPVADFFAWPDGAPDGIAGHAAAAIANRITKGTPADDDGHADGAGATLDRETNLAVHLREALSGNSDARSSVELAELALHAPGNIAWRALGRLISEDDDVSARGQWLAAAMLANSIRSLFNRLESTLLLDRLHPGMHYWQAVLRYCGDGNLQSVLDEFLHHTRSSIGEDRLSDDLLVKLATDAGQVLTMRPSRYLGFDPDDPAKPLALGSRFALRYGAARGQADDLRMPEVRAAFNSPFWPFVLASTSVGQEGIDFHWWCHSVVHWNTPASPVDFEQREGRVNRFGGHAVRRNVAAAHRADVMRAVDSDPWRAAYDAARATDDARGDFSPYWVYPGPHAVERHLLPFPLSGDGPRAASLKRDLTHYRLALGQPRQEDFLALVAASGSSLPRPLDLSPPDSVPG